MNWNTLIGIAAVVVEIAIFRWALLQSYRQGLANKIDAARAKDGPGPWDDQWRWVTHATLPWKKMLWMFWRTFDSFLPNRRFIEPLPEQSKQVYLTLQESATKRWRDNSPGGVWPMPGPGSSAIGVNGGFGGNNSVSSGVPMTARGAMILAGQGYAQGGSGGASTGDVGTANGSAVQVARASVQQRVAAAMQSTVLGGVDIVRPTGNAPESFWLNEFKELSEKQ